jgi:UDP-N-acetylglucosamine 2-epimerase (non-hydrolysing)
MRILHVVGARPNFMKVAPVQAALARVPGANQYLVHTGQHYDANMSDIFFHELEIRAPDVNLGIGSGGHAEQTARVMTSLEPIVIDWQPDIVLVYGDVNSTVAAALVCAKLGVAIGHVEAGLRSYDRTMPEEINRVVTDQLATLLFTPSVDGAANLAREGIDSQKVHFVGNVMVDTLVRSLARCRDPRGDGVPEQYVLATLHRPSNVDDTARLLPIVDTLDEIGRRAPVIFPLHPRARKSLGATARWPRIRFWDPAGYLEFLSLQRHARVVITDSGGVQEETTYLGVPCLTLRENTERPITVTVGTNTLVGANPTRLREEAERILAGRAKSGTIPPLWDGRASDRIASVLQSWDAGRHGSRFE